MDLVPLLPLPGEPTAEARDLMLSRRAVVDAAAAAKKAKKADKISRKSIVKVDSA